MNKQLSAGFDIAGVFSEASINSIFQLAYYAGLLPLNASTHFTHKGAKLGLELYFLPPTLQFVSLPKVPDPIKIRFSFLVQVPQLNAQAAGAVIVFATASKLQQLNKSHKPFNYVVLDFWTVPVKQYQFEKEPMLPTLDPKETKPQYDLNFTCQGSLQAGVLYYSDSTLPNFLPGTWQLKVTAGKWSTTVEATVQEWGKSNNKNTYLTFTQGVQGCGTAFGKMPAYPAG